MSQNAIKIIDRLKEELSIKTDKNLCTLLTIKPNTLSTWKKRDTLDFNKVIELCEKKNLDLNYIFFEEKEEKPKKDKVDHTIIEPNDLKKEPAEVNLFKEFQLVNTNRNIAIFKSIKSYHPYLKEGMVVIGQKIRKKQTSEDVLYIIEFNSNELLIDELQELESDSNSMEFKLKNYHPFNNSINPKSHIKHIWQYIDSIEDITVV